MGAEGGRAILSDKEYIPFVGNVDRMKNEKFKSILRECLERADTPEGVPKELDEEFDKALDDVVDSREGGEQ